MRVDMYLHSSKEDGHEIAEKLGLKGEAAYNAAYIGYEHKMTYEVDEKGNAVAGRGRRTEAGSARMRPLLVGLNLLNVAAYVVLVIDSRYPIASIVVGALGLAAGIGAYFGNRENRL